MFMMSFVALCSCGKNEEKVYESADEVEDRRYRTSKKSSSNPRIRKSGKEAPISFADYFGDPDALDINAYQILLAKRKLKASKLFKLANECEDGRIRESMLISFFTHFGHHNSLIVLDYFDELEPGGLKLYAIRGYAGALGDPAIAEKVFDWLATLPEEKDQAMALEEMGLLSSRMSLENFIELEKKYTGEVQKSLQGSIGYRYGMRDDAFLNIENISNHYGIDSKVTESYIGTLIHRDVDFMADRVQKRDIPEELRPVVTKSVLDQYTRKDYSKAANFVDELEGDADKAFLYKRLYTSWLTDDFDQAVDVISELPHSEKQRVGVQAIIQKYNIFRHTESMAKWQNWLDENYSDE